MNVDVNVMATNGDHVQKPQGYVGVTLSRRNLESLLAKLDRPGEATRTLMRMTEDGIILTIVAEEDEQHYGDRKPGNMGQDIEVKLAASRAQRAQDSQHEDDLARFEGEGGAPWPIDD